MGNPWCQEWSSLHIDMKLDFVALLFGTVFATCSKGNLEQTDSDLSIFETVYRLYFINVCLIRGVCFLTFVVVVGKL